MGVFLDIVACLPGTGNSWSLSTGVSLLDQLGPLWTSGSPICVCHLVPSLIEP